MTGAVRCPACGSVRKADTEVCGVYKCRRCEAIYGTCYLGDSYSLVRPWMAEEAVPPQRTRYFDFKCLSSHGVVRRHGWYDTETRLLIQVG